jgi:hypothetical protein
MREPAEARGVDETEVTFNERPEGVVGAGASVCSEELAVGHDGILMVEQECNVRARGKADGNFEKILRGRRDRLEDWAMG